MTPPKHGDLWVAGTGCLKVSVIPEKYVPERSLPEQETFIILELRGYNALKILTSHGVRYIYPGELGWCEHMQSL